MAYADGFIVPVPRKNLDKYRELAELACKVWLEYGALQYYECIADDVPSGEVTSFPRSVKLEPDEVVVFAWILYESRAHRDRVNEKVMKDPRMNPDPASSPFDTNRMIYGGFEGFVMGRAGTGDA